MQDALDVSTESDALCGRLVAKVREIADGNLASSGDVETLAIERTDHPLTAWLGITLGWRTSVETFNGQRTIGDGTYCGTGGARLTSALEGSVGVECTTPETIERAIASVGKPLPALAEFRDDVLLSSTCGRFYTQETCGTCGGSAEEPCPVWGCAWGQVTCFSCSGSGRRTCSGCGGGGSQIEQYWDNYSKSYGTRSVPCRHCGGSGRDGNCYTCFGSGTVDCSTCGGRGRIGCRSCAATGWHTYVHTPHITLTPSRSHSLDDDAPPLLKMAVDRCTTSALHPTLLDLTYEDRQVKSDTIWFRFTGGMPAVDGSFRCKGVEFTALAYGKPVIIAAMRSWLDDLLRPLHARIVGAGKSPADVLKAAQDAYIPRRVLKMVGGSEKTDVEGLVSVQDGAVSEAFVRDLLGGIKAAYNGLSRDATRRLWLFALPVIGALMAALTLVDTQGTIFEALEIEDLLGDSNTRLSWELGWPLVAVVAFYLTARDIGRRRLAEAVEGVAKRAPSQGAWPLLALPLALLYATGMVFAHGGFGKPRQTDEAVATVLDRMAGTLTTLIDHGPAAMLLDSPRPFKADKPVMATPSPPPKDASLKDGVMDNASKEADPARRLQENLRDLGLYAGPIDGVAGEKTREATARVLATIPARDKDRFGAGAAANVQAVRDDRIKLSLPDIDQVLVGPEWRNATRLRLTEEDRFRIMAAMGSVTKALPDAAKVSWTSGPHRGTLATFGPADDPQGQRRSCFAYRHEIVTEAGSDPGPARTKACKQGATWVQVQ